jgi:hypothetical protein
MGLRYLYRSPTSNSRFVRSVRLKWPEHAGGLGDNGNLCSNFVGNPFKSIHSGDQKQDERTVLRLDSLVAMDANIRTLDQKRKLNSVAFSTQANYTDRATAAFWRS